MVGCTCRPKRAHAPIGARLTSAPKTKEAPFSSRITCLRSPAVGQTIWSFTMMQLFTPVPRVPHTLLAPQPGQASSLRLAALLPETTSPILQHEILQHENQQVRRQTRSINVCHRQSLTTRAKLATLKKGQPSTKSPSVGQWSTPLILITMGLGQILVEPPQKSQAVT